MFRNAVLFVGLTSLGVFVGFLLFLLPPVICEACGGSGMDCAPMGFLTIFFVPLGAVGGAYLALAIINGKNRIDDGN